MEDTSSEWRCALCEQEVDELYTMSEIPGEVCLPCGLHACAQITLIRQRAYQARMGRRAKHQREGDPRMIS